MHVEMLVNKLLQSQVDSGCWAKSESFQFTFKLAYSFNPLYFQQCIANWALHEPLMCADCNHLHRTISFDCSSLTILRPLYYILISNLSYYLDSNLTWPDYGFLGFSLDFPQYMQKMLDQLLFFN